MPALFQNQSRHLRQQNHQNTVLDWISEAFDLLSIDSNKYLCCNYSYGAEYLEGTGEISRILLTPHCEYLGLSFAPGRLAKAHFISVCYFTTAGVH